MSDELQGEALRAESRDARKESATERLPRARPRGAAAWRDHVLFFVALIAASMLRQSATGALSGAVIWLPSGVAIAGLWRLGARAWWVPALAATSFRFAVGYVPASIPFGAAGATLEALFGLWILQRLKLDGAFARLADVLGLFVVAALAPLASLLFCFIGRLAVDSPHSRPFYAGWDDWWRMNTLGVLVGVPLVSSWLNAASPQRSSARRFETAGVWIGLIGVIALVLTQGAADSIALMVLYVVHPVSLYAAVRLGPFGAVSTAALAIAALGVSTDFGLGPLMSIEREERHVALQLFSFSLVAVPLVIGALLAERETALESRVRSDAARAAFQRILPDVTCRVRADGVVLDLFVPPSVEFGAERRRVVGRTIDELVPKELATRLREALPRALEGQTVLPYEAAVDFDGKRRFYEARFVRYSADEALCMVRDITDRVFDAEVLRWQAEVLEHIARGRPSREAIEALLRGVERLTHDGIASVLLLEGQRLRHGYAPSMPDSFKLAIDGIVIGPNVGSCGTAAYSGQTVVTPDVEEDARWSRHLAAARELGLRACWSVPLRDATGAVLGTFAVYFRQPRTPSAAELAVVERASALAGVAIDRERTGELLASINRNVNEALFRSAPDAGLVYVNDAMVRMFGYASAQELMNVDRDELFADRSRRTQLRAKLAERGALSSEEACMRRRDGSTFWALISATAVRSRDGRIENVDGAIADITHRKSLENELRQAQKMEAVGRLAGGVAHDFNNLLTAIGGYAEAISMDAPADSRTHRNAEQILQASERAASLTRQLLAYSRQQVLAAQPHDLATVVDELGRLLHRLIGEDLRLSIEHAERGLFVHVDRGQIEQVVLNLALNARDALPDGGSVAIRTAPVELGAELLADQSDVRAGSFVRLSVEDDGVGMDERTQQRAFDPFFTTKEQGKGTGLGLSTVYGIVRQSGGLVRLESTLGAGTVVSVYLPRIDAPHASRGAVVEARGEFAAEPANGVVLVVEDEPMVREIVTATLRRAGYRVIEAENGAAALELSRGQLATIALVVTDLVMPRMGGEALATALRLERADLPVLFISGYADAIPSTDGDSPADFLQKPFTQGALRERVAALLRESQARRPLKT